MRNTRKGNTKTAIELYQKILSEGYESSTLYYNLGNASFRSNKLGKARLYYEKSLKLNPNNEDATANIEYLEKILVDKFDEIPELFLKKWLRSLISLKNSDQWGWISMLTFVFSALLFSIYLLLRKRSIRKTGFLWWDSFIIDCAGYFYIFLEAKKFRNHSRKCCGSRLPGKCKIYSKGYRYDLFVLHEGAKVWLEDIAGEWQEIRLSDGRKGWLPSPQSRRFKNWFQGKIQLKLMNLKTKTWIVSP